ncbi:hypothetical protein C8A01DRAFT_43289 [Parachaetomium inaequale]|uniref:Uncharacterized protein n=1 Tax=Parachaetomium inaequale TaxID=2588326 RepID=A0AAN6PNB6_9PEZI|nr:hypothetical protein C8A01DRAFT_43289 [Parachaetomium inaequale]
MDWHPTANPFLKFEAVSAPRRSFFEYDCPSAIPTRVLRSHSEVFKADLLQPPSPDQDRSGYHILLCGLPDPVRMGRNNASVIPSLLSSLPVAATTWKRVTECFYLHDAIRNGIKRSNTSPSSTYLVKKSGQEVVEMYTAATSRVWPENLAIASTHFRHSKLTVAVIFGCTAEQMKMVERLLHHAPEVKSHPLLMVGVFAELHRDRVTDIVMDAVADCDIATMKLGLNKETRPQVRRSFELSRELRNCRLKTKKAEEEIRSAQGQLHKMMQQIEEWVHRTRGSTGVQGAEWLGDDFTTSNMRFKHRFEEISIEFDALMARCRMTFDDMTYSEELFTSELLSHDAESARHQAKASTVIAFVAMLYLPITTVATIFAMPVFDFANEWRDIYFRETGNEPDASNQDSDARGAGSPKPVLSFYFWIYLIVSVSLTAVTIFGWWRYTRTTRHPPKPKHRRMSYTGGTKTKTGKFISFMPEYEGGKDSV